MGVIPIQTQWKYLTPQYGEGLLLGNAGHRSDG